MTVLAEQLSSLYRDPLDVETSSGDLPVPGLADLERTLILALRDDDHEFAAVLASEIRRLKLHYGAIAESLLYANASGIWQLH